MGSKYLFISGLIVTTMVCAGSAAAATFGSVLAIDGEASDIALDESRGVLYIADFTSSLIHVMSLKDNSIQTSIKVSPQPGALALSPDNRFLVIAQYGGPSPSDPSRNAIRVIDLNANRQFYTFATGDTPLSVAFLQDGRALIVTTTSILFFDPVTGATQVGTTFSAMAQALPVPIATFPAEIIRAQVSTSPDRRAVYGIADAGLPTQVFFRYDIQQNRFFSVLARGTPIPLPRLSVSADGTYCMLHMYKLDGRGNNLAQFPYAAASDNIGGNVIDSKSKTIYAQILTDAPLTFPVGATPGRAPVLSIMDEDNLTVREKILIPQNITGRMVLNAAADTIYAVSDSGVMVLPVGKLNQQHRVTAAQSSIAARADVCNRSVMTMNLTVTDPSGGRTDFALFTDQAGVTITPDVGMTPAVVQVRVDPTAYQNQQGTLTVPLILYSKTAVNIPSPIRLLVNNHNSDQRGTFVDVPGALSDLMADPVRKRFYAVAHDRNLLLVFDGNNYQQMAALRTSTTPTQMTVSADRKTLIVGHENSQQLYRWDLDTFQPLPPIQFPTGDYPESIAGSNGALLATARCDPSASATCPQPADCDARSLQCWSIGDGGVGGSVIDRVDLVNGTATRLPSLGIWANGPSRKGHLIKAVASTSANGQYVLIVSADGNVLKYRADLDTFVVSRADFDALQGAYAASSFDQYVVGNYILDSSLVPVATMETATGAGGGFAFVDQTGLRTTLSSGSNPAIIERMDTAQNQAIRPTRTVEAPLQPTATQPFIRTLAPMFDQSAIISLTVSGFTVLPWQYDAAVTPPQITSVVNAADGTKAIAPGGLIKVLGQNLSPVNIATSEIPLPTALGESCLIVNGVAMPILFVSNTQINGQLPFNVDGSASMILHTPGGASDSFHLSVPPAAPSVFRSGEPGTPTELATVMRGENSDFTSAANPIRPGDSLVIYVTGLGRTSPSVDSGAAAPSDQLAKAIYSPRVTLGGAELGVTFAGLVPGLVGVYQINAVVPSDIPPGSSLPLAITSAGSTTTLDVPVVN